jgi:hypothetical protein
MSARPISKAWRDDKLAHIGRLEAGARRAAHDGGPVSRLAIGIYLDARETFYRRVPGARRVRLHALHPDKLGRPQTALEQAEYTWLAAVTMPNLPPVLRESRRRRPNTKQMAFKAYRTALVDHYRTLPPPPPERPLPYIVPPEVRTPTARSPQPGTRTDSARPGRFSQNPDNPPPRTPTARQEKARLRMRTARAKARAAVIQPSACATCGAPITTQRHGRRLYCSGACRARAARQRGQTP